MARWERWGERSGGKVGRMGERGEVGKVGERGQVARCESWGREVRWQGGKDARDG